MPGEGGIIEEIFEGVDLAIAGLNEETRTNIQEAAADPCYAQIEMRNYLQDIFADRIQTARARVLRLADDGHAAVRLSIKKWGRIDTAYIRSRRFTDYLINNAYVTQDAIMGLGALLGGGPWGAAIAAGAYAEVLQSRLVGDGETPPSGNNEGHRLGPGAYLYPDALDGRLQGSRVRRAYFDWIDLQRARVAPANAADWRDALRRLTGSPLNDWREWAPGVPYAEGSKMWSLEQREDSAEAYQSEFRRACLRKRAWERGLISDAAATGSRAALLQSATPVLAVLAGAWLGLAFIRSRS